MKKFFIFFICLLSLNYFCVRHCSAVDLPSNPITWTIVDQEALIQKIFIDLVHYYPKLSTAILQTRTDKEKLKLLIVRYINRYGRKYARSLLVEVANDIGLQTESEVNQFVIDCKELMKALLPQKMLDWAHIYLIMQTQIPIKSIPD